LKIRYKNKIYMEESMESYDAGNYFEEKNHTVRVTLQYKEYFGHISYNIGGNCFGYSVLGNPFEVLDEFDMENLVENDCNLQYSEDNEVYYVVLKNSIGDTLEGEFSKKDISNMIICMEIVSCEKE